MAFDVVGTLFSLDPVADRMRAAGLPDRALDEWFGCFLRDGMALDAAGSYTPFRDVAAATLEVTLAGRGQSTAQATVAGILQGFAELPAHPDAEPALRRLTNAGVRVVTLSDGSAATTERLLKNSKLDGFVERILSIDDVQHWKPRREVYLYAAVAVGVAPVRIPAKVNTWIGAS
ncbi:MAG TPA: HAD family hydrolase [Methylomirabilota bacterium]|nr:HAD family hydrolase [Methylomirabilota bacterium]